MYNSIFQYNDLDQNKVTHARKFWSLSNLQKMKTKHIIVHKISDLLNENPDNIMF